jgi:Bacterial PH domain
MRQKLDAAVITNRRLIILRHGMTGTTLEDCQWRNVLSVHLKEGLMGTTFSVLDRNDHLTEVEDIPKEQTARLCQLALEMRE